MHEILQVNVILRHETTKFVHKFESNNLEIIPWGRLNSYSTQSHLEIVLFY